MSMRFRIIQLKRNKFAKITIGTIIILLLLLALYHRSENIHNSRVSTFIRHSKFTNQVMHIFICVLIDKSIINYKII